MTDSQDPGMCAQMRPRHVDRAARKDSCLCLSEVHCSLSRKLLYGRLLSLALITMDWVCEMQQDASCKSMQGVACSQS